MHTKKKGILISLLDSIQILKNGFSVHVESVINSRYSENIRWRVPVKHIVEYDYVPFFNVVFDERLDTLDSRIQESIKVLVNDGMDDESAKVLTDKVFKSIIMIMSVFISDIDFVENGYRYFFYGKCDLLITPPYRDWLIEYSVN